MRDFSITVDIDARPEDVWAILSDGERWPEWTSSVTSVKPLNGAALRIGQRVLIRQPKLPPAVWEITELREGRSFTWVTRSPGVTVTARHGVEAKERGSTARLSLRFDGLLGGLVGRMTRGLNERYLGIEAAGLKRRCEGDRGQA